jgi:hypothetical protein
MHRRLALACCLAIAVGLAPAAGALAAGTIPSVPTKNGAKYINPFTDPAWQVSRTDMGVDWVAVHKLPVRAIGDAVILGSDNHSGWPGNHLIFYQLLDGSLAGDVIYVAEHLKKLAPVGRIVRAGQQIAVALPGYPYTEWGWADQYGSPRAYPCYKEGRKTNSGNEMSRFLTSLGAPVGDPPGRGPARPTGRLC